ncbi:MAG: alpha-1,4-glucan--maltose-1-phosphate maltosyltransferase [Chitinophagales bacterium]|nr:alpha-1,4-glucan--maltose-1-phosphate maltosyltransferase [Chitinophagales bacterium]
MQGQLRVYIDNVTPEIESGKYSIAKVVGEKIEVEADIFCDGHDLLRAQIIFRHEDEKKFHTAPMSMMYEDHWRGNFTTDKQGKYYYTIEAWMDHALTWKHSLKRRMEGKEKLNVELLIGAKHLKNIKADADKDDKEEIKKLIDILSDEKHYDKAVKSAMSERVEELIVKYPYKEISTTYKELPLYVDRKKARFSNWYELFPRSTSRELNAHGTFKDVEALVPRLQEMGVDVLYLPPIHPIGTSFRKGKNNSLKARKGEPGVPWGIAGHKEIHPELGTLTDFKSLVKKAGDAGIEIALDYALQCSPDHHYVEEHPEWFTWRPDGTAQYAENPPKKYQDVVPFNFETEDWESLWNELKSIVEFWIEQGVNIFRVDNPHTKSLYFWQWMIAEIKKDYPDTLFLAEAFTKPKLMYHLAKIGFTQSYTYFTWRNSKAEFIEYMEELTQTEVKDYFRPNFWMNTPDILPFHLQNANEAVYITRLFLAATLSSNYGFYGPVYELQSSEALPGREEYLNSEKYEIRNWDWKKDTKLKMLTGIINRARRDNEALQQTNNLQFLNVQNDNLLAYYKESDDGKNKFICVVNLDSTKKQQGFIQTPLEKIGKQEGEIFIAHDLLNDSRWTWSNRWNYVELDPSILPCHLFRIEGD